MVLVPWVAYDWNHSDAAVVCIRFLPTTEVPTKKQFNAGKLLVDGVLALMDEISKKNEVPILSKIWY